MKKELIVYAVLTLLIAGLSAFESKYSTHDHEQSMIIEEGLNIKSIESTLAVTIFLVNHDIPGLKIEGNKKLLENLALDIKNGHLQIGQQLASYNPLKLLKLAMLKDEDLKIYVYKPHAKDVYVHNAELFNEVDIFENDEAGMITLKKPKLFHTKQSKTPECLTLDANICKAREQLL